ncbi:hypothetical protein [Paraburkholderia pallida]|uniref:hypothetical protein n=1 Tax=Paraburkholderia pallida TaxID=2547399 RepID=UPI00142FCCDC|nr:hypothetical protein [Paraburkholderia pallida]
MKLFTAAIEARPRELPAAEIAAHRMNAGARHAAERERRGRSQHHRCNEARGDRPLCVIHLPHSASS